MPWLVFAAAFAFYALGASPALGWYDAPEFVAAAASLGVPHSPGHPTPVLLGAAAALLPVGDLAWRVNLASALASAAAVALLAVAGRTLLARLAPELSPRLRAALAAGAALSLAASHAALAQAVRAEVYGLTAALLAGAVAAVLAWDRDPPARTGRLVLAGLACGLALTAHHLIAVAVLLPCGVFVLARRRPGRPGPAACAATALAGVLGLAAFLYLPVRSAAGPLLDWGAPHEAGRFVWTVSAAMFADAAGGGHASPPLTDAAQAIAALAAAVGPVLAALALPGAAFLLHDRSRRPIGALLVGLVLAGGGARVLVGFDPDTPDDHGYLLPAAGALALLGLAGAAALARLPALVSAGRAARTAGGARAIAAVLAAAIALAAGAAAAITWRGSAQADAGAADELGRLELEELPPRAVLLASYYQTDFRALAMRLVEGTRPDVAVLHRRLLSLPGAPEAAARRHPDLAPLIAAPLRAGAPSPLAELAAVAARRPVLVELDPDLDPPVHPHLVLTGRFARFAPRPPGQAERAEAEAATGPPLSRLRELLGRAAPGERTELARVLLWQDFAALDHHCRLGRLGAAHDALLRAWELFPGDVMLAEWAARCGLDPPAP